jgi:hypothetical protein
MGTITVLDYVTLSNASHATTRNTRNPLYGGSIGVVVEDGLSFMRASVVRLEEPVESRIREILREELRAALPDRKGDR